MINKNWKRQLKIGDVLTLRNGQKLFYTGNGKLNNEVLLDVFNDDLQYVIEFFGKKWVRDSEQDIIKIERPIKYQTMFEEQKKQMTIEEIEKTLGYKIEIVDKEE